MNKKSESLRGKGRNIRKFWLNLTDFGGNDNNDKCNTKILTFASVGLFTALKKKIQFELRSKHTPVSFLVYTSNKCTVSTKFSVF